MTEVRHSRETKVKICGLSRIEDIGYVNQVCPDYIGFVFASKSHRYVTQEQAAALKEQLDPAICAVGVFVDEAPEVVAALLKKGVIDLAQLHGHEDESYLRRLRELTHSEVIQAFRVQGAEDLVRAQKSTADYLLLDSANAGSGQTFDWSLLMQMDRPYFLAGGLHPGNIREALSQVKPYGVDVSSGVETDRKKDQDKIRQFVSSVRDGDREDEER